MTVNCQEAMVEAQASERIVAGASTTTIESLRARLLSERAASKEARQQAHKIAQKVSELQSQLDAEIEYRKKAEAAMNEVLEVLKSKGLAMEQVMATNSQQSESSESEEAAPISSSKDGESEHSSVEEALHAHIGNPRVSVDEALHNEDLVSEHEEGCISEDNSSDKTQSTMEETLRSKGIVVEKEGVNKDEEGSTHKQAAFADLPEDVRNVSLLSSQARDVGDMEQSSEILSDPAKQKTECKERDGIERRGVFGGECMQSSEILSDPAKLNERREKPYSNAETGLPSSSDSSCLPSAKHVMAHQEVDPNITQNMCLSSGHQVYARSNEASHLGDAQKSGRPQQDDMSRPGTERVSGLRPKDVHVGFLPKNGYVYDTPKVYNEYMQQVHNVSSSSEVLFSRGPVNFSSTPYQSREHVSSDGAGFGRYPQAPINDAILSLVDDKKGKLGNILMALQLAKKQLNDEEHVSPYMEEKFTTSLPIAFSGKPYTGFYDKVPHQQPYEPWRPEPHNAAPIIHFPVSPTSDHGASPFERHDGLRRSSSTSAYYMPSVYDAYLQPKGEVHLGNGITLYTD